MKQESIWKQKLDAGIPFNVISINVYRHRHTYTNNYDPTNGGISGKVDTLYIPCETGPFVSTNVDRELIMEEEQRSADYWCIKPVDQPAGMVGPMFGGNLATCSDSRVKHIYGIHDRFETSEQYDILSR